MSTKLTSSFK